MDIRRCNTSRPYQSLPASSRALLRRTPPPSHFIPSTTLVFRRSTSFLASTTKARSPATSAAARPGRAVMSRWRPAPCTGGGCLFAGPICRMAGSGTRPPDGLPMQSKLVAARPLPLTATAGTQANLANQRPLPGRQARPEFLGEWILRRRCGSQRWHIDPRGWTMWQRPSSAVRLFPVPVGRRLAIGIHPAKPTAMGSFRATTPEAADRPAAPQGLAARSSATGPARVQCWANASAQSRPHTSSSRDRLLAAAGPSRRKAHR